MILKIIAMGFFMRAHSYLRDPWNVVSTILNSFIKISFEFYLKGQYDLNENILTFIWCYMVTHKIRRIIILDEINYEPN